MSSRGVICYYKGYNVYSTISDSFIFKKAITILELIRFTKKEEGLKGLEDLTPRMSRALRNGTSMLQGDKGLKDFLCANRAGKEEKHLSIEQCKKQFLTLDHGWSIND